MGLFDYNKIAGNPLLQSGLGILANNTGHYGQFAPAFGRGAQQGMQNVQRFNNQNQLQEYRQQQLATQKQRTQLQTDALNRQLGLDNRKEQALTSFSQKNQEFADLVRIDPKAAIKAAYPSSSSSSAPYFTPIGTEKGLGSFDNRKGTFNLLDGINGHPLVKSVDSVKLQTQLAAGREQGKSRHTLTEAQPGVIQTTGQLVNKVSGGNVVPADVQTARDAQRTQILQSELESEEKAFQTTTDPLKKQAHQRNIELLNKDLGIEGGGIKVPTKAEEAAEVTAATEEAKYNSPQDARKRQKAKDFKATTAKNVISSIDSVLSRVDSMSAGVGGNITRALPINSDAKDIMADIVTIKSNFGFDRLQTMRDMSPTGGALGQVAVQELEALQASVANIDVENQSPEQLSRNLLKAKKHYQNWLATLTGDDGATSGNQQTFDTMPKASDYKGKIINNPETGERFKSNGLSWKKI